MIRKDRENLEPRYFHRGPFITDDTEVLTRSQINVEDWDFSLEKFDGLQSTILDGHQTMRLCSSMTTIQAVSSYKLSIVTAGIKSDIDYRI